ncbi:DUF6602 domain-containing protein [Neptuniibacter sp.]|uniref:DUF6602 domain-containing protein n=1 Tax=Neptuniibacter sp. TaxID=1962643 RepID=UPI0026254F0A|nr:DUF6602 domain-containing protein [Neptuniibacter sp.]MCP4594938.1 hypothetical protein [Neptuniibacter sp.]
MEVFDSYYQAIMARVESEVHAINGMFDHQGVKGVGNESVLIDLLCNFLPKKYGVGTGIVVDKSGTQSKQCDIVIFDAVNYPEIFSLTSAKFFPVDFVYATIEVKTTLDSTKTKDAIANIRSAQSLEYIKEEFRHPITEPFTEIKADTPLFLTKSTTPPLGLIFAYSSTTSNFDTFSGWFDPSSDDIGPTHLFALDQGLLVDHPKKGIIKLLMPFVKNDAYINSKDLELIKKNNKEWAEVEGRLMPFSTIAGEKVAVDQAKVLLQFLVMLAELLNQKSLSPNIKVYKNYISEANRTFFTLSEDGELGSFIL